MITFKNFINRFEQFASSNQFIKTFSHGSPAELDLDKFEIYPLMHVVYTGSSYDVQQKTYSFEVYILDLPADKADKTGNQLEAVSNSEQTAEDILADMRTGGSIFSFDYRYNVASASTTPLEEQSSNVLSGILLDVSIEIGFDSDSCNAPLI